MMQPTDGLSLSNQKALSCPEGSRGRSISRKSLVNILNRINFRDGTIQINFFHDRYERNLACHARPQPCEGEDLECRWTKSGVPLGRLKSCRIDNILVNDRQRLLVAQVRLADMDEKGIRLILGETCYEVFPTTSPYLCRKIDVQLIQNSAIFRGTLVDFSPLVFHVEIVVTPPQTFQWVNTEVSVYIILSSEEETLYSGECEILGHTSGLTRRTFEMAPVKNTIHRFKKREYRSPRLVLVPSPSIMFPHPLIQKSVHLRATDLSGSGFSVEEQEKGAVLLPGMILPEMELQFHNGFSIKCRAQVIHRKRVDADVGENSIRCGLVFLDMNAGDHLGLLGMLQQAKDEKAYVCGQVDTEALWDFLFDTGFIYPEKYRLLQQHKEQVKLTYEKIYKNNPRIARHFIYEDKGVILGHMSMLRFYKNSWLVHHHAANTSVSKKAGIAILHLIGNLIRDSLYLHSTYLDFVIAYFQPSNRFPSRVFGGAAEYIGNPKGCSVDTFAYLHFSPSQGLAVDLPPAWRLVEASPEDLQELEDFYEYESGGLMLTALDLIPNGEYPDTLSAEFQRAGLKRERHLLSLRKEDLLTAIFMVNISDVGLNLSDLTNCIKVIVLSPETLTGDVLLTALDLLCARFSKKDPPVLIYPAAYAEVTGISCEKKYNLWVLNSQYGDHYFKHLERLFKFL